MEITISQDLIQRLKDIDLVPSSETVCNILNCYIIEDKEKRWEICHECDRMAYRLSLYIKNSSKDRLPKDKIIMRITEKEMSPYDWHTWNRVNNYKCTLNPCDYMNKKHGIAIWPLDPDHPNSGGFVTWEVSYIK